MYTNLSLIKISCFNPLISFRVICQIYSEPSSKQIAESILFIDKKVDLK